MSRAEQPFPIVGVGASAGGLEALEGFFKGLPNDPGVGIVVVTHLNPEHGSLLHEIISRYTALTVNVAADGAKVGSNCVYVLPAGAVLGIQDGRLTITRVEPERPERKPIDIFFSTLAKDQGEYAAGVVLSGGDSDGTLGIKAIKELGGLTLAQAAGDHGPAHASMPESAISTGLVDFPIPVEQMGAKLAEFAHSFQTLVGLAEPSKQDRAQGPEQALQGIYAVLLNQVGHDFSGYKTRTFLRRVQRRMLVVQLDTIEAYLERLRQDSAEVTALFRDLLINVTNFFRDMDAFDKLAELVIPGLFEGRGANDVVRVWVPGCATGEEVFSIAILMREHMDKLRAVPRVQIFATDIDENALAIARIGRYPEALLDSLTPERRQRFFTADGASYVLNKDVRELCIFSPHSVIRDPPFSHMDLISCRNLLIYFSLEVQKQVIPTFHYALRPGGYLFLGTSENVSQFRELFTPVDSKHRIFRRREGEHAAARVPMTLSGLRTRDPGGRPATPVRGAAALRQSVETQVLDRHAPAHVVVNRDGDVVFYSSRTGKYLEPAAGAPSRQLLTMARKGLRLDLRTLLKQSMDTGEAAGREGVAVEADDGRVQLVDVRVEPVDDPQRSEPLYLVVFNDRGPALDRGEAPGVQGQTDGCGAHMERELRDTRERLQSQIEEYETALEELKSSNEELVSVNEELQSTNEELEASKEELQSVNEELHTVNSELSGKVEALDRANADLQNLFESTHVATVFLDRDLVIRTFTPAMTRLFHILPGDKGRPITDLSGRLTLPTLAEDIRAVFSHGKAIERHIDKEEDGLHFLVRLVPYRNGEQKIDGVIVTFVDVSSLARAEAHQRVLIAELNHRVKNMMTVVVSIAELTFAGSASLEDFKTAFMGRIRAMARSYELVSSDNWKEASMAELIRLELEPFGLERTAISGPELRLRPSQALSMGMVLHELATNAGKHGALSVPGGQVAITWTFASDTVKLRWCERDGPQVAPADRRGFGLRLVERETVYNLGGKMQIDFDPKGLAVELEFPLAKDAE